MRSSPSSANWMFITGYNSSPPLCLCSFCAINVWRWSLPRERAWKTLIFDGGDYNKFWVIHPLERLIPYKWPKRPDMVFVNRRSSGITANCLIMRAINRSISNKLQRNTTEIGFIEKQIGNIQIHWSAYWSFLYLCSWSDMVPSSWFTPWTTFKVQSHSVGVLMNPITL